MIESPPWIAIVDDDLSVLSSLSRLLRSRALRAKTYGSAQDFLAVLPDGLPGCLIVDLQMPGMTGLELLQRLKLQGIRIPTIIITAHDDPAVRERCKSTGAIAFLSKPLQDTSLFAAINNAGTIDVDHSHEA
jgi:FixJ family two-component response regulator